MRFQLISADGLRFDEDVYEVLVPTKSGVIAIFRDHMPLLSAAAPGVLSIRRKVGDSERSMEHFAVFGGVIEIDGTSARLVTDDVTTPEEVSEQEATEALKRAEQMVETAGSQAAIEEAKHLLQRSAVRLEIAKLKRHHHR
ncbi:MAG: ATP synthase F1 subunit epsilon [Candidatus Saccharimonadales bacterium]